MNVYFELDKGGKNNLIWITSGTYITSKESRALFCGNVDASEKYTGRPRKRLFVNEKRVPPLQQPGSGEQHYL